MFRTGESQLVFVADDLSDKQKQKLSTQTLWRERRAGIYTPVFYGICATAIAMAGAEMVNVIATGGPEGVTATAELIKQDKACLQTINTHGSVNVPVSKTGRTAITDCGITTTDRLNNSETMSLTYPLPSAQQVEQDLSHQEAKAHRFSDFSALELSIELGIGGAALALRTALDADEGYGLFYRPQADK